MAAKVPPLTKEERRAALDKAKIQRRKRAEIKNKVHDGELTVEEVIGMKDDEAIGRIKVQDLIRCVPGYGIAKSEKIMNELEISLSRRLKGLGSRQKEALLKKLAE